MRLDPRLVDKVQPHDKELPKKYYVVASDFFHKQIMAKLYVKPFLRR